MIRGWSKLLVDWFGGVRLSGLGSVRLCCGFRQWGFRLKGDKDLKI